MNEQVRTEILFRADTLLSETEGLADALQYTGDMADEINADLSLGYAKTSDSYGVLYKACETAIRDAHKEGQP